MIKIVKVSVIVPVYNSEKYLSRCIESVLNQKLKEIELLLVNDGSTDNSLEICKKYAGIDNRIKIIDKQNGGVSSARNAGIDAAKGEFIGFVDSDDWINPEMYSNMYKKVKETGSDICICNFFEDYFGYSIPNILKINKNILLKDDIINDLILNMIAPNDIDSNSMPIMGSVWRLLINRELILNNNIRFPLNIHFMEDFLFCINTFLNCSKISIDSRYYYHYCYNNISASRGYIKDMHNVQVDVFNQLENILQKHNLITIAKDRLKLRYINLCIASIINEIHNNINFRKKYTYIKYICSDNKLNQYLKDINTNGYTLRKKAVLFALKHKMTFYIYIYYKLVSNFKVFKNLMKRHIENMVCREKT